MKSLACFLPPLLNTVRTVYFSQARRSPNVKPFGIGLSAGYLGGGGGTPVGAGAALVGAALDFTATTVEDAPYDGTGPLGSGGAGIDDEEIGATTDEENPRADDEIGRTIEDDDPVTVIVFVHVVSPP